MSGRCQSFCRQLRASFWRRGSVTGQSRVRHHLFRRLQPALSLLSGAHEIGHLRGGSEFTPRELADMMIELQDQGCHNINLVTPSHQVPHILDGLSLAAERGLGFR